MSQTSPHCAVCQTLLGVASAQAIYSGSESVALCGLFLLIAVFAPQMRAAQSSQRLLGPPGAPGSSQLNCVFAHWWPARLTTYTLCVPANNRRHLSHRRFPTSGITTRGARFCGSTEHNESHFSFVRTHPRPVVRSAAFAERDLVVEPEPDAPSDNGDAERAVKARARRAAASCQPHASTWCCDGFRSVFEIV